MSNPVRNPSNGNYYQAISDNVTWDTAFSQANQATYRGLQGYLVTVTSAAEDRFVHSEVVNASSITGWGSFGGYQGTWLGGSDKDQEGTWRWMNGPEQGQVFARSTGAKNVVSASGSYSNFLSTVHDGDSRTNYDFLVSQVPRTATSVLPGWTNYLFWDDIPTNIGSAEVIEYGAYGYGIGNGYVIEYGGMPATYKVNAINPNVDEGASATFEVLTTNVEWGTVLNYSITGISSSDITSGVLSGSMVVQQDGKNGKATISIPISADTLIEGSETLTLNVSGQAASVTVIDSKAVPRILNYGTSGTMTIDFDVTTSPENLSGVSFSGHSNVGTYVYANSARVTTEYDFKNPIPLNITSTYKTGLEGDVFLVVSNNSDFVIQIVDSQSRPEAAIDGVTLRYWMSPYSSYSLTTNSPSINEGATASFQVSTKNVAAGTSVPYTISGVSASDVVGGQLSGTVTVGVNGQSTISVLLAADALTEGSETLTVTAQGQSATITINDTSLTPQGTYALSAATNTINEGSTAAFALTTTNVPAGTNVPYTISGISASDVVGGQLSGSVNIGINGQATISVPLAADLLTEGNETLTVTTGSQSASVTVLDTSTSPLIPTYSLSAAAAVVAEGGIASFTLTTTNISAGSGIAYLVSGLSEADVVGNLLSGSVTINQEGKATITVPIASDNLTEGTETLRVIVADQAATMAVADTSVGSRFFINFGTLTFWDSSVKNDTKVVVNRVGDITRIEGNQENNTLVGTDAIDRLLGGGGSDRFYSSKGNDVLDGGDGTDGVTFRGKSSDFRVEKAGSNWLVRDTRTDVNVSQGEDTLTGVERVGFEDKVLALDTEGVAGKAYRVYKAAFNRDPMSGDTKGLGFWIDNMDNGMDLVEVSERFVDSNEFRTLYGTNPTNAQFLTKLYQNVLGRTPEATGYNWWLNELNTNPSKTKAKVLADFAEGAENQAGVASLIGNGITYEPWMG
jgi:Domain of unknown function (DUF4214)/RTX calcium-binding nonapeptide repeat (4 copies)